MTAYLLSNHIINLLMPAAALALGLVLMSRFFRFFRSKRPVVTGFIAQFAIIFIANVMVLSVGLLLLGNDGKMLTYAALVVVAASVQWALWRGWSA